MGQRHSEQCMIVVPDSSILSYYLVEQPPEIIIDNSLVRFSGLDSASVLQGYMSSLDVHQLPGYTEKLGSALGGLNSIPNAVGLAALVISMILELIMQKTDEMSTGDILRRVFAEEKASEIRDLMDEYMRRLKTNLRDSQLQQDDTKRIESVLSAQITRLKNSMTIDGHMTTRALSHWVNGAAFHVQMLIHQARLEGGDGARASAYLNLYQEDLKLLNDKYRVMVDKTKWYFEVFEIEYDFGDEKCNMELEKPKQYFMDVKRDLQALIAQHNTFNVVASG